jgi:hypothetical protein
MLAIAATPAGAATTIGTVGDGPIPSTAGNCFIPVAQSTVTCTFVMTTASGADLATGGLFAPAAGVITSWHALVGTAGTAARTVTPRVLAASDATLTGKRSGTPRALDGITTNLTFPDRLTIAAGDLFALDVTLNGPVGSSPYMFGTAANPGFFYQLVPALANGSSYTDSSIHGLVSSKFIANATIEPDRDLDGYGDETQDLCPSRSDVQGICTAPVISVPKYAKGKFTFTSDVAGKATTRIDKVTKGRKSGKKCKASAKKGKKCSIYTKFAEWKDDVVPGSNSIAFAWKVGGKRLKRGTWRATIVVAGSQNLTTTKTVTFKIK